MRYFEEYGCGCVSKLHSHNTLVIDGARLDRQVADLQKELQESWAERTENLRQFKAQVSQLQTTVGQIKYSIDHRLNSHLVDMKPNWDDSITGFNEAWDIVRKVFAEHAALATCPAPDASQGKP